MAGPLRRPVHSFGCTGRGQGSLTGETRGKRQTLRAREAVKRCARLTPFATIRTRNLGRVSRPHTSRAREDPSPRPHPASGIRAAPRRLRAPCASTPGRGAGWGWQAARRGQAGLITGPSPATQAGPGSPIARRKAPRQRGRGLSFSRPHHAAKAIPINHAAPAAPE